MNDSAYRAEGIGKVLFLLLMLAAPFGLFLFMERAAPPQHSPFTSFAADNAAANQR